MKQPLENLTIKRFRGLQDLELKDLGQVNLFVGPNNSGKTSILEAIATYCRPLDPLEWLNTSRRREAMVSSSVRLVPYARLAALRWLFPQTVQKNQDELYHGETQIQSSGSFAVHSVKATYQEIRGVPDETTLKRIQQRMPFQREPDANYQGAELHIDLSVERTDLFSTIEPEEFIPSDFMFWEAAPFVSKQKSSSHYSLPVRTITPVSHRTERSQVERFSEATLDRETEGILELVRLFDSDIVRLQILAVGGTSLYVEHKKSGLTPLSAFGDGLRRVIMIALTLPRVKKGVLLIDEIETAIHISVLKEVYQWLFKACEKNNVQLFATTHSLEAVDALLTTQSAPYAGLVAYRLGQPGKPAKRYSGELLNRLRNERGLDVRYS